MLDEVSLDAVARAQRLRRGFGWGDVLVVAATIIWGVNVVVVKLALTDSGPFTYSAIRYVLGALALCGLARWLEGPLARPPVTDAWLIAAAAAAGVLVNQASFAGALALTNADNIAMISGTTPLLVVGWLVWRNRERFEAKVWAGLGLGLVGLVLVVGAAGGTWSSWVVVPVALANPLGWAVYLLLLPRLLERYRPLTLAAWVTMVGALMLVPFGTVEALNRHPHVTGPWLGLLAYSALAAVALTTWLYLPGVRRLGPARTTVYSYLQPFLTVIAAGLMIGEPILPLQLLGGVIMLVGVVMGRPRPRPGPVPLGEEPTIVSGAIADSLAERSGGCALQGDDLPEVADINGRGDQPVLSGYLQDPLRRVQKHLELPPPNPQSPVADPDSETGPPPLLREAHHQDPSRVIGGRAGERGHVRVAADDAVQHHDVSGRHLAAGLGEIEHPAVHQVLEARLPQQGRRRRFVSRCELDAHGPADPCLQQLDLDRADPPAHLEQAAAFQAALSEQSHQPRGYPIEASTPVPACLAPCATLAEGPPVAPGGATVHRPLIVVTRWAQAPAEGSAPPHFQALRASESGPRTPMERETRLELATSSLEGMCSDSYSDPPGSRVGAHYFRSCDQAE